MLVRIAVVLFVLTGIAFAINESRRTPRAVHSADLGTPGVEIFTTADCGVCIFAKQYMDGRGIAYHERPVDTNAEDREAFRAIGGYGVPVIVVDGTPLPAGFDEARFERALAR